LSGPVVELLVFALVVFEFFFALIILQLVVAFFVVDVFVPSAELQ
jgi:hypothetical protein